METDASIESISNATPALDPANQVPDEYDVLCEGCGYSLVGISSNQCPECGHPFDPAQLPFARIPWLHRRRIGRVKAYLATLRFVLARPKQFAEEICRPVRISIDDARSFRRTCVNIVLLAYLLCVLEIGALVIANYLREARAAIQPQYMPLVWYLTAAAVIAVTILFGLRVMLFMMTDLPVSIWKGHPSLRAGDLSPIQCYAAAALAPLFVVPVLQLLVIFVAVFVDFHSENPFGGIVLFIGGLVLAVFFWRMLTTPQRLMIGSGVDRRRANLMKLYLPFHWLIMALVCTMLTGIVVGAECAAIDAMNPAIQLQPPLGEPLQDAVQSVNASPPNIGSPRVLYGPVQDERTGASQPGTTTRPASEPSSSGDSP